MSEYTLKNTEEIEFLKRLDPTGILGTTGVVYLIQFLDGVHKGTLLGLEYDIGTNHIAINRPLVLKHNVLRSENVQEITYILNNANVVIKKFDRDVFVTKLRMGDKL